MGPVKYIAALIYGDNPDTNILEKAVRWVIILIVIVFDPLALTLLLAATKSLEWERGIDIFNSRRRDEKQGPFDDWTEEDFDAVNKSLKDAEEKEKADDVLNQGVTSSNSEDNVPLTEKKIRWAGFGFPMGSIFKKKEEPEQLVEELIIDDGNDVHDEDPLKEAKRAWKLANPDDTLKKYEKLHAQGKIKSFPWEAPEYHLGLEADNLPNGPTGEVKGFGTQFPKDAVKGDMYLRVDQMPSVLYKFNGRNWIEVDKGLSDQHAYDEAYIDHLISKIETGELDPDLLSDAERDSIEKRLG